MRVQAEMLTSLFKKSVSRTRIRQFTSLVTCKHVQTKIKHIHSWTPMKDSFLTKSKLIICRLYNTEREDESDTVLPPLAKNPICAHPSIFFSVLQFPITVYKINLLVDNEFDMKKFDEGSKKAISVISTALSNKNYEALQDLVVPGVIEILKDKLETLNEKQLKLIATNEDDIIASSPLEINLTCDEAKDPHEWLVQIKLLFYYQKIISARNEEIEHKNLFLILNDFNAIVGNYTFERTYKDKVGGPWTVTWVNHFSSEIQEQ